MSGSPKDQQSNNQQPNKGSQQPSQAPPRPTAPVFPNSNPKPIQKGDSKRR